LCGSSYACVSQTCKKCTSSTSPGIGTYTPSFSFNGNCSCNGSTPQCYALYRGKVTSISSDGWHANMSFTKADGTTFDAVNYWIVVTADSPSCSTTGVAVVRVGPTAVNSPGYTLSASNVPIWASQSAYDSDPVGTQKNLWLITDDPTHVKQKLWFQQQYVAFTKSCP